VNSKSKHSFMSAKVEIECPAGRWRHSRYTVLAVGLCVLVGVMTLDTARSAVASEAATITLSSGNAGPSTTKTSAEPADVSRKTPPTPALLVESGRNGERRRLSTTSAPVVASVPPLPADAVQNPGAPVVTSLSPNTVSAGGGATVTIIGNGFAAASAVYFGPNESSNFSVISPTEITATAPTDAGSVDVSVVTPLGTSWAVQGSQLTYLPTGQLPITASGQNLEIGGVPTKFTGVNAYELATAWGTNAGCGGMETPAQVASLFSSLAPHSIVRFWAFQGALATDINTHEIDWAPIDELFYLAAEYHVYLLPSITDQGGTCDGGHWQDPAWYNGGYRDVFNTAQNSNGDGLDSLSYWAYMQELVSRYENSPALGMWEPISEPEASTCAGAYEPLNCGGHQTCQDEPTAAADLLSFFDTVGGEIHALDPVHLVEAGFLGSGQCGTAGPDYRKVGASPGIDVLSVHDTYGEALIGGDQWNGLAVRFGQAAMLGKPIITGETGIIAGDVPGCVSLNQRAVQMAAKMEAQFTAGSSAFLVWDWVLDPLGPCSGNTGSGDPLMNLFDRGQ
jgi:mannan endo-1,4-beta-mannosidase